jgi:dihydrofolate reductase
MAKVIVDMAMSLDGFISGRNGEDHGLHDYFFSPAGPTKEVIEEGFRTTGAILMGRRAYEIGAAQDGFADDPYQVPTFVLTHHIPERAAKGAEAFLFVTGGIESALEQAKASSGDRNVVIGGGADTAQQYLKAGLVDEIQIHLIHTLLTEGIRLFDQLRIGKIAVEKIRVVDSVGVTHMRFRLTKQAKGF